MLHLSDFEIIARAENSRLRGRETQHIYDVLDADGKRVNYYTMYSRKEAQAWLKLYVEARNYEIAVKSGEIRDDAYKGLIEKIEYLQDLGFNRADALDIAISLQFSK